VRYKVAVPFIVFLCAVGAVIAFERARPDTEPARTRVVPAFERLNQTSIAEFTSAAAAIHEQRAHDAQLLRTGRALVLRSIRSIYEGAPASKGLPAEPSSVPPALQRLRRWGNELPVAQVTVVPRSTRLGGTSQARVVHVRASQEVRVYDAKQRARTFAVPVEMSIRQRGQRWTISAVRFKQQKRGLGSIDDPVLIVNDRVTVIAHASRKDFAQRTAVEAKAAFDNLHRRYKAVSGPARTSVYVIEQPEQIKALIGEAPAETGIHPSGWTYETGEVVLSWKALGRLSTRQQDGVVWHESVHAVTLPLIRKAPTVVLEGVATLEEADRITRGTTDFLDLRDLRAALRDGTVQLKPLLEGEDEGFSSEDEKTVELSYLAGYATVMSLRERFGHAKLIQMLARVREGETFIAAATAVTKLEERQLIGHVRVWVANHVRRHPVPDEA
jgi:hypothetical protein